MAGRHPWEELGYDDVHAGHPWEAESGDGSDGDSDGGDTWRSGRSECGFGDDSCSDDEDEPKTAGAQLVAFLLELLELRTINARIFCIMCWLCAKAGVREGGNVWSTA